MSITAGDGLQYVNRLLSDLWTNSISWQDSDSICSQGSSFPIYLSHTLPWNLLMCNNLSHQGSITKRGLASRAGTAFIVPRTRLPSPYYATGPEPMSGGTSVQ